jgi:hypothetical protein
VLTQLHAPIAYFLGRVEDIACANAMEDVVCIDRVPLFFGSTDVGYDGTFAEPHDDNFDGVGAAWLRWRLLDDQLAGNSSPTLATACASIRTAENKHSLRFCGIVALVVETGRPAGMPYGLAPRLRPAPLSH